MYWFCEFITCFWLLVDLFDWSVGWLIFAACLYIRDKKYDIYNTIRYCIDIPVLCFVSLQPHAGYHVMSLILNSIILENPFDIMKSNAVRYPNKAKQNKKQQLHLPVYWQIMLNTTLQFGDGVVQLIERLTRDPKTWGSNRVRSTRTICASCSYSQTGCADSLSVCPTHVCMHTLA